MGSVGTPLASCLLVLRIDEVPIPRRTSAPVGSRGNPIYRLNNKLHHGRTIMKSGIITAATSALLFSGVANAAEIKVLTAAPIEYAMFLMCRWIAQA
jgi:hypothetical protein